MPSKKHYALTNLAERDLQEAKLWSISRWGREHTQQYFNDLHKAAENVATHYHLLNSREDLTGETGLSIHPVREYYLVYFPISEQYIIIVAVIRQSRDIPKILSKAAFMIRREVIEIKNCIKRGSLSLPE
ncbi:MAG: type II toxin-antitoxin system RelE/ParE family toxin [Mariprofundaceae bacterium]|nr:type II toxin-antitoxin system RelE/ParE family toxin [Mariprofundaceae bacterium]